MGDSHGTLNSCVHDKVYSPKQFFNIFNNSVAHLCGLDISSIEILNCLRIPVDFYFYQNNTFKTEGLVRVYTDIHGLINSVYRANHLCMYIFYRVSDVSFWLLKIRGKLNISCSGYQNKCSFEMNYHLRRSSRFRNINYLILFKAFEIAIPIWQVCE